MDELNRIKQEQKKIEDKVLSDFAAKWGQRDGYRRFKLLQESVPRITKAFIEGGDFVPKSVHPDHMEMYLQHLIPRVRGILENCGEQVIRTFEKAPNHEARLAMIIKCINIMDAKAEALKAAHPEAQSE